MTTASIRYGRKTYTIIAARWNSARQLAEIAFEDETGKRFETIGWGMSPAEQRQAVLDEVSTAETNARSR